MSDDDLGNWFADTDPGQDGDFQWQPCLDLDGHTCSIGTWFRTKAECERFIRDTIIPATR